MIGDRKIHDFSLHSENEMKQKFLIQIKTYLLARFALATLIIFAIAFRSIRL